MSKTITMGYYEFLQLEQDLANAQNRAKEFGWLIYELRTLVAPEEIKYLDFSGQLPPEGWKASSTEEILNRIKEKLTIQGAE